MKSKNTKTEKRDRSKARIRAKISGTGERPRLAVFRSNTHIYAQVIDDSSGKTLLAASDIGEKKGSAMERSKKVGEALAKLAAEKKIEKVVFDRGGFKYAGRIKALAEAARSAGLIF